MAQVPSWRTRLIESHPRLFPASERQLDAVGYIDCEEGWSDLLARLCVRMEAVLRQGETIHILQIKEKFATLRVYWRGEVTSETVDGLQQAIALAKARSACTCETCGAEGRLHDLRGVYMTRCTIHAQCEPVLVPSGQHNVHLVRIQTREGYRIVARRYDRAGDRFADGDPTVFERNRPETAVTANWRTDFMQAHPRLFEVLQGQPESESGYPSCQEGWRVVLEQLCTKIEAALGHEETFRFVRIGQKIGFLQIKWEGEVSDGTKARIEEAVSQAHVRAARTCGVCGLEGRTIKA